MTLDQAAEYTRGAFSAPTTDTISLNAKEANARNDLETIILFEVFSIKYLTPRTILLSLLAFCNVLLQSIASALPTGAKGDCGNGHPLNKIEMVTSLNNALREYDVAV